MRASPAARVDGFELPAAMGIVLAFFASLSVTGPTVTAGL